MAKRADFPSHIHVTQERDLYLALCVLCGKSLGTGRSHDALRPSVAAHECSPKDVRDQTQKMAGYKGD